MKKERPIPFCTEMVQAILARKKNTTRRIAVDQYHKPIIDCHWLCWSDKLPDGRLSAFFGESSKPQQSNCPYGTVGDLLWVKESWAQRSDGMILYRADQIPVPSQDSLVKWKPSRFMPKQFARIWLEIESVDIQRLQSMSTEDAIGEGVTTLSYYNGEPVETFFQLWDSLHTNEVLGGDPYVWVVKFHQAEKPI